MLPSARRSVAFSPEFFLSCCAVSAFEAPRTIVLMVGSIRLYSPKIDPVTSLCGIFRSMWHLRLSLRFLA